MPYAKGPTCGTIMHLNVGDVAAWFKDNWPGYQISDLVPLKCPGCWFDRQVGHRVRIRSLPAHLTDHIHVGDIGVVIAIDELSSGEAHYPVEQEAAQDQPRWCAVFYLLAQQPSRSSTI